MKNLLVISTGISDVQLVVNGSRQVFVNNCGALHDAIEQRFNECQLVDSPLTKQGTVVNLPDDEILLCTPKLDAILRYFNDNLPVAVLILETKRKGHAQDPRFAGAIIEHRLREKGIEAISRCSYLTATDGNYDDKSHPKDAIVRRDVVARIDEAVHNVVKDTIFERVVIASTGGTPVIASLIDEIVQLHATTKKIEPIEIEDGSGKKPPTPDAVIQRSTSEPHESYRARRHALDLIDRGNLLAAWGAVQHLTDDDEEKKWTKVLKWVNDFAASLPVDDNCDIALFKPNTLMAVRSALRVEFALRAGDIPRAVHGTVAFCESALWDHLKRHITPHRKNKSWYKLSPTPDSAYVRVASSVSREDNSKRPFERCSARGYYSIHHEVADIPIISEHYLKKVHLKEFSNKIQTKVRRLRNDVAHTEATPEQMAHATGIMVSTGLWNDPKNMPAYRFLSVPTVTKVLHELGVTDISGQFEELLKTVRERLLVPQNGDSA